MTGIKQIVTLPGDGLGPEVMAEALKILGWFNQHFGTKLRLAIQVTESVGSSPAAVADREKQQKQVQATAAIEQDPFVRELVENFDGRLRESTIKPVDKWRWA